MVGGRFGEQILDGFAQAGIEPFDLRRDALQRFDQRGGRIFGQFEQKSACFLGFRTLRRRFFALRLHGMTKLQRQRLGPLDRGCEHDGARERLEVRGQRSAFRELDATQYAGRGRAQAPGFLGIEPGLHLALQDVGGQHVVDGRCARCRRRSRAQAFGKAAARVGEHSLHVAHGGIELAEKSRPSRVVIV